MRPELIEAGAVLVITFAYLVLPRSLPLIIWATMMGVAFMETSQLRQGVFAKMGKVLLATPLQFLGRISYSVYMVHMLVFYAAASLFPILEPGIDKPQYLILNILGVVSVTVLLSAVCYRVIEVPGMKLGRRLTERMAVKPRKTADDPVHGAIAE
jgi:peptidoglycan/LPS O-acetylase OafA/YrhL